MILINSQAPYRSDQRGKNWQARRDSNPQHAVLETAALPVGATGLGNMVGGGGIEPRALREPGYSRSRAQPALLTPPIMRPPR